MTKSKTKLIKLPGKTSIPKAIIKKAVQKAFMEEGTNDKIQTSLTAKS